MPEHREPLPQAAFIGTEEVRVRRLDAVFDEFAQPADRVFLKLDVQGCEREVLRGGAQSLAKITGVQLEMSLQPLYKGAPGYVEMIELMAASGFTMFSLEPGLTHPQTGQVFEFDGLFFRR